MVVSATGTVMLMHVRRVRIQDVFDRLRGGDVSEYRKGGRGFDNSAFALLDVHTGEAVEDIFDEDVSSRYAEA